LFYPSCGGFESQAVGGGVRNKQLSKEQKQKPKQRGKPEASEIAVEENG
jgi:hypothetical protein